MTWLAIREQENLPIITFVSVVYVQKVLVFKCLEPNPYLVKRSIRERTIP